MIREIKDYRQYLKAEKRYSPNTCLSYSRDLDQCAAFLEKTYDLESWDAADHRMIRSWLVSLAQYGLKAKSINRKISSLRTFFTYLKKHGLVSINPVLKLSALKSEKRLPATIDTAAIDKLHGDLREKDSFKSLRDLVMIEIFYQTGLRRSELRYLRHSDIDRRGRSLKVTGKGNKERIIPIGPGLLRLIEEYESKKRNHFSGEGSGFLIVTDKGEQVYPKYIYNRVTQLLSTVSTADKRNPHVLRHSFATQLSNNGAELNAIKELLGHESLAATQIYTHNSIEKLKKAYRMAHPKS